MIRWARAMLVLATALAPSVAQAVPGVGTVSPQVSVEDTQGQTHTIPSASIHMVVFYESKEASEQNRRASELVGTYTRNDSNRSKFLFRAIADVDKWNWWPAKKYVLADIREIEKKRNTTVLIDWTGAPRKAWGLTKHKSGILVVRSDGTIAFAAEGPLSDGQLDELRKQLDALGASPEAAPAPPTPTPTPSPTPTPPTPPTPSPTPSTPPAGAKSR